MAKIGRRGGEARGAARGRGAGVANSGSSSESGGSGFQNSRNAAEREVEVEAGSESGGGVNASTQGNRGANNSIGGETRKGSTLNPDQSSRGESYGNH